VGTVTDIAEARKKRTPQPLQQTLEEHGFQFVPFTDNSCTSCGFPLQPTELQCRHCGHWNEIT
jgi:lipopolysaccharide biosynthesis regulator YciM